RYSAASDTPTSRASPAVVTRPPGSASSMCASAWRICSLREIFSSVMAAPSTSGDQGADAGIGENFQQHRMGHATIDDVRGGDAVLYRTERTLDFRQHAAEDSAIGNQFLDALGGKTGENL